MKEKWKSIIGYENIYEVSNLGDVRVILKSGNDYRAMKQEYVGNGYRRITLSKNGVAKHFSVHRLVAQTFIPNPDNLPQVNHIDEDKTNNRVDNLEWCTPKYNINFGNSLAKRAKSQSKAVLVTKIDTGEKMVFESRNLAAKMLEVDMRHLKYCLDGKLKKHHGFEFENITYLSNY